MKVLGIITARGGSKGIPGKNLKLLGGKPLLAHTVDAVADCALDRVILSTEDQRIAEVGRSLGVDVPDSKTVVAPRTGIAAMADTTSRSRPILCTLHRIVSASSPTSCRWR